MEKQCIFCTAEENESETILYQSENFYTCPAMKGALGLGHVLLVPKKHIRCFGAMPPQNDNEFWEMVHRTEEKLTQTFSQPHSSEMGVYGQTIPHAHLHFVLSSSHYPDYNIKSLVALLPEDAKRETSPPCTLTLDRLRETYQAEQQYLLFREHGKNHICHTKDYKGDPIRLRELFVKATGLTELADWKVMPQEFQTRNNVWIAQTISALKE